MCIINIVFGIANTEVRPERFDERQVLEEVQEDPGTTVRHI